MRGRESDIVYEYAYGERLAVGTGLRLVQLYLLQMRVEHSQAAPEHLLPVQQLDGALGLLDRRELHERSVRLVVMHLHAVHVPIHAFEPKHTTHVSLHNQNHLTTFRHKQAVFLNDLFYKSNRFRYLNKTSKIQKTTGINWMKGT